MKHSFFIIVSLCFILTACAYRLGSPERSLPGGYRQIAIPIFKNKSYEVGSEVDFTNALILEFERAKIARIAELGQAEAIVEGEILSIEEVASNKVEYTAGSPLPTGTSLASDFSITVSVKIVLKRQADKSVLWEGLFARSRSFKAGQVTLAGINTVNSLYNLSARRQNIQVLAQDMMNEAHSRMTENF